MRVICEPGDRYGNAYAPDFDFINQQVKKLRTPEQIAPPSPRANRSPLQSYPSGSNCQNAAQLAYKPDKKPPDDTESPRSAPSKSEKRQTQHGLLPPWKALAVENHAVQEMQEHLLAIVETYPSADFGPANRTTARDMIAAAKCSKPDATPDDVGRFLAGKFADKRPYPYENGLRTFGGIILAVFEDFPRWLKTLDRACPVCGCPRRNEFGNCAACCRNPELAARIAMESRTKALSAENGLGAGV